VLCRQCLQKLLLLLQLCKCCCCSSNSVAVCRYSVIHKLVAAECMIAIDTEFARGPQAPFPINVHGVINTLSYFERARQRLSVTLQKGVSLSVARCFLKTRCLPAVDGVHVAPDITAHMRLRLLVRPQHAVAVPVVVVPAVVCNIPVKAVAFSLTTAVQLYPIGNMCPASTPRVATSLLILAVGHCTHITVMPPTPVRKLAAQKHASPAAQPAKATKKPRSAAKAKPSELTPTESAAAAADEILRALGSSLIEPPAEKLAPVATPVKATTPSTYRQQSKAPTPAQRKERQQIKLANELDAFYGGLRGCLQHNSEDLQAIVERSSSRLAREQEQSPVQAALSCGLATPPHAAAARATTTPAAERTPESAPAAFQTPTPPRAAVTAPLTAPAPLPCSIAFATPTPRRPTHATSLAVQFGGLSLGNAGNQQLAPVGAPPPPPSQNLPLSTPFSRGGSRGHLLHGKVVDAARATAAWLAADASSWHQADRFIRECMADFANPPTALLKVSFSVFDLHTVQH
jgi:hypothetical protein